MAVRKKSAEVAQRQDALGRLATANAGIAQGLFAIAHSGQAPDWAMRYRNLAGRVVRTGVGISDGWTAIRSREPASSASVFRSQASKPSFRKSARCRRSRRSSSN